MAVVDYFIKFDGIKIETADVKHKNEIDVESWSWGETNAGSSGAGGGGGAGKVAMQDFHFVMKINKASIRLMKACATGEHIKEATLTSRKAGKDQQEFLTVKLTDVLVSSFQSGGSEGSQGVPTDQVSLNYAKIEFQYKEQKADGTLGPAEVFTFDLKAHKAI